MSDTKNDRPPAKTGIWAEIDRLKAKYETDLANAVAVAKETGFKNVRCTPQLRWFADRSPAVKFEHIKNRPNQLGGAATAAELVALMRSFVTPAPAGGAQALTEADHAKAAAFLDAKR